METFWFFRLRFRRAYDSAYDSDIRFSLGHKLSYDSDSVSDSDSVASENQPLVILWENAWKTQRLRARENCRKTFRKTSYALAFSWSRKTIDEHHAFMAFTVSNSVGKRLENAAFARSRKLQKNIQENKLFINIFLVLDNMRWTSCFLWVYRGWTVNLPSVFRYQKMLV